MIPTPEIDPGFPNTNGDRPQGTPAFPEGQPENAIPSIPVLPRNPGGRARLVKPVLAKEIELRKAGTIDITRPRRDEQVK